MTRERAAVNICLAVLLCCPSNLGAQGIKGRLFDDQTGRPISGAIVKLIDAADQTLHTALTDDSGSFTMSAVLPRRYRLRAEHLGYEHTTSPPVDIRLGEVVEIELQLSTQAIPLAPLKVVSDRPALVLDERLLRWGYYDREARYGKMGFAHFLDQKDIDSRILMGVSQLFEGIPGVRTRNVGGRKVDVVGRKGCPPTFYLDGTKLSLQDETIDQLLSPVDLLAVEIYPGFVQPARYSGTYCGVIVLWTGMRR